MRAQDEGKASISAILQYDAKISSNSQDTVCGSLARGVGFCPLFKSRFLRLVV